MTLRGYLKFAKSLAFILHHIGCKLETDSTDFRRGPYALLKNSRFRRRFDADSFTCKCAASCHWSRDRRPRLRRRTSGARLRLLQLLSLRLRAIRLLRPGMV